MDTFHEVSEGTPFYRLSLYVDCTLECFSGSENTVGTGQANQARPELSVLPEGQSIPQLGADMVTDICASGADP
jgi:hypothetical protein